jgi:hypothetical protein
MTRILKRITPTGYFLIIVLIVMAVFFVTSLNYEMLKVKLMPSIMSGLTMVFAAIALVRDFKAGTKATQATDEEGDVIEDEEKQATPLSAYFNAFYWVAGLIALIYFLGFLVGMPIWMIVFLMKNNTKWWKALPQGVGFTILVYLVFTTGLHVELFKGLFGDMVFLQMGL